ncbi:MAG TPA: hypothetical protein VF363_07575 [Candidatus Eisenbacteria bacterium]
MPPRPPNRFHPPCPSRLPRGAALLLGAALALSQTACSETPPPRGPEPSFESQWQDGKAELDGYRYEVTRYGERRSGRCVMIFVTEPFSESLRVKVDDPSKHPGDVFEALKLNFVRQFQTGIYDYNTMVSVFTRSADFSPAKITLSSAEWCGSVYGELIFRPGAIASSLRSYFEGESGVDTLAWAEGGVAEDDLYILLRGLRGPYLAPGARKSVPFLPSPFVARLTHRPIAWTTAEIGRADRDERVLVPAGSFRADRYTIRVAGGREGRVWVERDAPHRIIRWAWSPPPDPPTRMGADACDAGELAGSARLPYWRLHDPGQERYLRQLGLSVPRGR